MESTSDRVPSIIPGFMLFDHCGVRGSLPTVNPATLSVGSGDCEKTAINVGTHAEVGEVWAVFRSKAEMFPQIYNICGTEASVLKHLSEGML